MDLEDSRCPPGALPPPGGWTLAEAAATLLPSLYAPAALPPPEHWWMAGGAEAHAKEREALRLAFARLMETGQYVADGIVAGEAEVRGVQPRLWRAATFTLGLPGEPPLPAELCAGGKHWHGVRVRLAATPDTPQPVPVYSIAALRAWYRLRVNTWPAAHPPPGEADDIAAAAAHFRREIPRDPFRAIRRELAPDAWKKPGPRRKRGDPSAGMPRHLPRNSE